MPILCFKAKLLYFPVPKVACTSLKTTVFELDNERPFQPIRIGYEIRGIHDFNPEYASHEWQKSFGWYGKKLYNLAVVRDPVDRLVSCYRNRVLHFGDLKPDKWRSPLPDHVPKEPSLEDFVRHLDAYRAVSQSIMHHSAPIHKFLGPNPEFFNGIFRLSELDRVAAVFSERAGARVEIPRLQTAGPEKKSLDIPSALRALIEAEYAEDYRLYGDFL